VRSEFRESGADGEAPEVGEVGQAEFRRQVLAMGKDGFETETEIIADRLGGPAPSEEAHDFAFAGREPSDESECPYLAAGTPAIDAVK
jgi:hypothetical protein